MNRFAAVSAPADPDAGPSRSGGLRGTLHRRPPRIVRVILTLVFWVGAAIGAAEAEPEADAPRRSPYEPQVSAEEAELLRQAEALAETDPAQAVARLQEAAGPDAGAALWFALGALHHRRNRPEDAIDAFRRALAAMPEFRRARRNLAKLLLETENHEDAAHQLVHLLDSGAGGRIELWKLLGYARLSLEQPAAAESAYRSALALDPDDDEVRQGILRALLDQDRLAEARTLALRELEKDPARMDLWKLAANADLSQDRPLRALVRLECARRLGLGDPASLATLGDLFLDRNLPEQALEVYREAALLDHPPTDRLLKAAEAMITLNHLEQAGSLLEQLGASAGERSRAETTRVKRLRARLAAAEGRLEEAIALREQLLDNDPANPELLMRTGRLYQQKGDLETALVLFERAARVSRDVRPDAWVRQAQIAVERGRYQRAVDLLEQAQALEPRDYVAHYLQQVRRLLGRPQ